MVNTSLEHLAAYANYYKVFPYWWHIMGTEGCLKLGNYCDSIVDILVIATTHVLHLNLSIYLEGPDGNLQVREQTSDSRGRAFHLKFTKNTQNPNYNHYGVILLYENSSQTCDQDKDDLGRHIPTREQMTRQHEYEVI